VNIDELWADADLLEVVAGPEVDGRRQSMVGVCGGDGGSEYSFARCCWPVTRAETHVEHRREDGKPIT
jgi:hypothetical protein